MSGEHGEIRIPIDLDLKWAKEKLLERDKQIAKLREENSKLREDLREGISLRDHFAGWAMQGTLSADIEGEWNVYSYLANQAYQIADAMLKEREKQ